MWAAEKSRRGRQAGAESRRCRAVLSCKQRGRSATQPDRWAPLDPHLPRPRSWHRTVCNLRAVRKNCTTKNGGFFQAGYEPMRYRKVGAVHPILRVRYKKVRIDMRCRASYPLKVRFKFTTRCFAKKIKEHTRTKRRVYEMQT
jgi:hypothetical protein